MIYTMYTKTIIALLLIANSVFANTYYIATDGNNSDPGTITEPWLDWAYALTQISGGDTVYFRGGTYDVDDMIVFTGGTVNGTQNEKTAFFGYPDETVIFDFLTYDEEPSQLGGNTYAAAISMTSHGTGYLHFKDFEIRNVRQHDSLTEVTAIWTQAAHNLTFENITIDSCNGRGVLYETVWGYGNEPGADTTMFINCDVFDCADSLPYTGGAVPGNQADGFKTYGNSGSYIVYRSCRAWKVSDDGFDLGNGSRIIIDSCWSFQNGYLEEGEGTAFKTGGRVETDTAFGGELIRIIKNCIASECRNGFRLLEYPDYLRTDARFINNFAYNNVNNGGGASAYGFNIDRNEFYPTVLGEWYNNISYNNEMDWRTSYMTYTESHNTWDGNDGYPGYTITDTVTVTDGDFVSLDIELLKADRKSGGYLPEVSFGSLVSTSDLIDAGTTSPFTEVESVLGYDISYNGATSDIGPFEYGVIHCDTITAITVTLDSTAIDTIGSTTGAAYISVSGGTYGTSYTYYWTPGGYTTQDITGMAGGSYTIVASDDSSCTGNRNVFISSISPESNDLTLDSISVTTPSTLTASDTTIFHVSSTGAKTYYLNTELNATDSLFILSSPGLHMLECKTDNDSIRYRQSSNRIYPSGTIYGGQPEGIKTY